MARIRNGLFGFTLRVVCPELPIVDELGSVWMQSDCGHLGQQSIALDVAMGAKAGRDAVKVAVVVSGMAAEFEGAFGGHRMQNLVEGFTVEIAGGRDADGSVGGENAGIADLGLVF